MWRSDAPDHHLTLGGAQLISNGLAIELVGRIIDVWQDEGLGGRRRGSVRMAAAGLWPLAPPETAV